MKGLFAGLLLIALLIGFSVITYSQKESELLVPLAPWQKLASPGQLSASHSHLENDCSACHTATKGPSPAKCIACHATDDRLLVWPELQFHMAVPDCRSCHREHRGTGSIDTKMDHDLIADMSLKELLMYNNEIEQATEQAPDNLIDHSTASQAELRCVACHLRRDVHREMFGQQCRNCHNTEVWKISEYRHPSSASTVCSQCHRAPPCHFTPHFKKVCAVVAGQLNAKVSDCHSCHQLPSWNSIKGAGWYESH